MDLHVFHPIHDLEDPDLSVVADNRRLTLAFNLSGCTKLTDAGLGRVARCCTSLQVGPPFPLLLSCRALRGRHRARARASERERERDRGIESARCASWTSWTRAILFLTMKARISDSTEMFLDQENLILETSRLYPLMALQLSALI
jgi:hypothetical protein